MYKLCVAVAAILAVAVAKPNLGFAYETNVAPVATSYSAYAPVVPASVYSSYAPVTTYAAAPFAAYPAYSAYSPPLTYTDEIPTSFLWKKK